MTPTTRATVTAAAAALIGVAGFLGTRYLAIAVLGLITVTALGWPALLRASRRRQGSVILIVGGALSLIAVVVGRTEPHLRLMVITVAAMVIAALASEVFYASSRGRTVTSVAAVCAGAIVVASGAAWVAASRTEGGDDLVIASAAAIAISSIAAVATRNGHANTLIALVLGTAAGLGAGAFFPDLAWYAGGVAGLVCAIVVTLLQELHRREPQPRERMAGMASAVAPVLSAGALVYIGGRLLLG